MERLRSSIDSSNAQDSGRAEDSLAVPFAANRDSDYRFQRESILLNAPESSGVYGLFSSAWIHLGEAENIRARLLAHLDGDNPCISRYQPSNFAFELVPLAARHARFENLARRIQPLCDGKEFTYRTES